MGTSQPESMGPAADLPAPAYAIIAGFGVPGRSIAELLSGLGISYAVIDLNGLTATRRAGADPFFIVGDARDEAVLRQAGIERATLLAAMVPDEHVVLEMIATVRRVNPRVRVIARLHYTSMGLKATQLGAEEVVVAEQVVADAAKAAVARMV